MNRRVATRVLQRLGCQVAYAENGRIAVDLNDAILYDLILMDCQMPETDGPALRPVP